MDIDPGFRYIEEFRGGIQWYLMESIDFVSIFGFKLKNKNGSFIAFFNGQSISLRLLEKKF